LVELIGLAENPIGKRVGIESRAGRPVWREIVGVVADVKQDNLIQPSHPHIFVPFMQFPRRVRFCPFTRRSARALWPPAFKTL
jgi:hypothetical protein